jgi:hypothetical protein
MIHLEMTPATSDIRAYLDQPDGYAARAPYRAKLTVMHLSDTLVYLQGAVGKVDRETWTKAFELLRAHGVKRVQIERRGRMRFIDL